MKSSPIPFPEILPLLKNLVDLESPSGDKGRIDRLSRYIGSLLGPENVCLEYIHQSEAGDHLIASFSPSSGKKPILLLCHMDTVWDAGTLSRRPMIEEGDRLYGPGVLDMKGGIAIAISTLLSFSQSGNDLPRPVILLCTSDEEVGSTTSRPLIERLARDAELVLCLEPGLPDGSLKTSRKGVGEITIRASGRAAHAGGDHKKGRNAIEELCHHVLAAQRMTDYGRGTTLNVGCIKGGSRSNVVPEQAAAVIDFRVTSNGESERILKWAASLHPVLEGTSIVVEAAQERPPMLRDERMAATFQRICRIGAMDGLTLKEGSSGGGSDASFVACMGIAVMDGLGAVGDGAHAVDEFIVVSSLVERAALLRRIILEW